MNETKTDETKPKKIVGRSVAITLGIICVILVAGLGVTVGFYTMTISDKDRTITSLTDINNLANFTILANNQTTSQTAGNYTSWTFIANFTGYLNILVQSSTTNNWYVRVIYNASVPAISEASGAFSNYQWVYLFEDGASYFYQYDKQVNSTEGTNNIFPVFPWLSRFSSGSSKGPTTVEVRVGNTNTVENATENVMIVYYY